MKSLNPIDPIVKEHVPPKRNELKTENEKLKINEAQRAFYNF